MIAMAEHIWRRDQRWLHAVILMAGVVGVTTLIAVITQESARRLPAVTMLRQILGFQVRPAVLDGVIVDLTANGADSVLAMTTMDGQDRHLLLNMQTTGVFVPGAVLGPSHLRPGQHIEVMASLQGQRGVARTIRIVKGGGGE